MADKLVGLLGPGKGPKMFTGNMRNLVARIAGLTDGVVQVACDGETLEVTAGDTVLPATQFVQFNHEGKSKNLICILRSKADAVSSP